MKVSHQSDLRPSDLDFARQFAVWLSQGRSNRRRLEMETGIPTVWTIRTDEIMASDSHKTQTIAQPYNEVISKAA